MRILFRITFWFTFLSILDSIEGREPIFLNNPDFSSKSRITEGAVFQRLLIIVYSLAGVHIVILIGSLRRQGTYKKSDSFFHFHEDQFHGKDKTSKSLTSRHVIMTGQVSKALRGKITTSLDF